MKLTIQSIGEPRNVTTKYGLKQTSYIKVSEPQYADKFLNYWLGEQTKDWKIGSVIDIESIEPRDYTAKDGSLKTSHNIKLPRTGFAEILNRIETLEGEITKLKLTKADKPTKPALAAVPYPEGEPLEPNFDNPPF